MFKQILILSICVLSVARLFDAAVYRLTPQPKPEEFACQEGCYVPQLNMVLPYNKPYYPQDGKSCEQYTCGTDGETQIFTCGVVDAGQGCHIVEGNLSLAYPKCCQNLSCP